MKKKTVLITGGTRGIGQSIRNKLIKENFKVIYTGTKNKKDKNYLQLDLNDQNSINDFIKQIEKIHIDILIINSGINIIKSFLNFKDSEIQRVININFLNNIKIIQIVLKRMIKKNFGRIIFISSIWGVKPAKDRSIYSFTKKSLQFICKSIASEYGHKNILVNSISPGFIETELTKKSLTIKKMKSLKKRIPQRRFGKPEEIANLAYFLISQNSYISGQNIIIDGGFLSAIEV